MNQTVTVNLSGIVFHIEVDAYEQLKAYLNKIKSYFKNSEESGEIMTDIEARIVELFNKKITKSNQVIRSKDVEEVIDIMGKPEQYLDDESDATQGASTSSDHSGRSHSANSGDAPKRMFRDPDNRIIGGVASGVSAYIGIDPVWLRLFLVIGLFMGFGFLLYVILWIVIPEAKTASEKLQMKGEPVNFQNIGKTVEEEANKMGEKLKDVDATKFANKAGDAIERIFLAMAEVFTVVFKFLGKIIGFAFLIVGLVLCMTFLTLYFDAGSIYPLTSDGIFFIKSHDFFMPLFNSEGHYFFALAGIALVVVVPILGLLYAGLKILFGFRSNNGVGVGLTAMLFIGIAICFFSFIRFGSQLRSNAKVSETQEIVTGSKALVLEMDHDNVPGELIVDVDDSEFFLSVDKKRIFYGHPDLRIERSSGDKVELLVVKRANGGTIRSARENARNIEYSFQYENNVLNFDPYLSFLKEHKFRGQGVKLRLEIPLGQVIYLDPSMENVIQNIDNVTNTWDHHMIGEKWVMLEKGLTCLDCDDIEGVTSSELEELDKEREGTEEL